MDARRKFGNAGEDLAARYLADSGFRIIARQWKNQIGEIDLVAEFGGELIFIEVKSRSSDKYGTPEEAVHAGKLAKLQMLAESYCQVSNWNGRYRIDVIAIEFGLRPKIRHLKAVS
ncbi:MAG: YraN family protein [bacterium]